MFKLAQEAYGPVITHDLLKSFVGKRLGYGVSREVFALPFSPDVVVKIATVESMSIGITANTTEHSIWDSVSMFPEHVRQWFCPCKDISDHGVALFMARADPIPKELLPKRIPHYFTDLKVSNWGLYNGKPVCIDYATNLLHNQFVSKRLRNADWY